MRVVVSIDYFSRRSPPQTPQDLSVHNCINLRLPTYGSFLPWEFEKEKQEDVVQGVVSLNPTVPTRTVMQGLVIAFTNPFLFCPDA